MVIEFLRNLKRISILNSRKFLVTNPNSTNLSYLEKYSMVFVEAGFQK